MKNQTAHMPWIYGESNDDGFSNIRDPKSGHRIAQVMGEENAAFIVRAVNAHEELIKRSKELIMRFNNLENLYFKETGYTRGEGLAGEVIRMNEAITKAEGK